MTRRAGAGRMRAPLLLLVLALAGCAAEAPAEGWAYSERAGEEAPLPLGEHAAFDDERTLAVSLPQASGAWTGTLRADEPLLLRFEGSVPMRVELRVVSGEGVGSSASCNWDANETAEKDIGGIGRVNMRSTDTTCRFAFTPTRDLGAEGPTLRWGARAREPPRDGWTLQFSASRG